MKLKTKSNSWDLTFEDDLSEEEKNKLNQEYFTPRLSLNKSSKHNQNRTEQEFQPLQFTTDEQVIEIEDNCCGNKCLTTIQKHKILERQLSFVEMNKHEQDICIISQLTVMKASEHKKHITSFGNQNKRIRFKYRFDNNKVICRKAFMMLYQIKVERLKRLQKLAAAGVFLPPRHGNTRRIPKHAVHIKEAEHFRQFINSYAEVHGLPDPGRLKRDTREILLPASMNYTSIWDEYQSAIESLSNDKSSKKTVRIISYHTFCRLWKQMTPHIKFISPRTDLCDKCDELKNSIAYANTQSHTEQLVEEYNNHCSVAHTARQLYCSQIKTAKKEWERYSKEERTLFLASLSTLKSHKQQKTCSKDITMHYSFDFAQQIYYPFSNQQRSKEYFKTARKCQIFGVCAEALPRQVYYLIDESEFIGKGSKTVISLLDAFFELHGLGEKKVQLHADNCAGQNKNNYMVWYLLWRTMNGLHEEISLSFMVPGHTKFDPDRFFALLKLKYRRSTIDSIHDLAECVLNTSKKGYTVPQVYGRHYGLSQNAFEFRDWNSFLCQYFEPIEGILKYNYFDFNYKNPGWVQLRVHPSDEPKSVLLLKERFFRFPLPFKYPEPIFPEGLTYEREMYLYKEIRPLIRNHAKRDLVCPKPSKL